jgi:hypothetical protein
MCGNRTLVWRIESGNENITELANVVRREMLACDLRPKITWD